MTSLPDYVEFRKFPGIPLKDIFSAAGDDLLDMLDRLLDCNPSGRVNATQVQLNSLRIRASLRTFALIVSAHPSAHATSPATSCMSARAK